jgi:YVTN family beta-propeller protein
VEFVILGPLEARDDGRRLALGGPKQRAVLAMLLLDANRPVSRDRLIDRLWGESPPPSAAHTLDDYVSRLRRALGAARIERHPAGYLIRVEPGELDLERFEALLEQGRAAAADGDAVQASTVLGEALDLWRGRALADLENEPFATSESERLEERRLLAEEARIEAELELGRGGELVGELERLVAEHPFRERLLGQLMLALYQAGRQAEALAAYQAGRRRLAAELGLEPGPELRELERRILAHDTALAPATTARQAAGPRRLSRRSFAVAALALAVVGVSVAAGVDLGTGTTRASSASAALTGVSEFDSHLSRLIGRTPRRDWPAALAADHSSLWLAEPNASEVVRIDRGTRRVIDTIPVSGTPALLAVGGDAAWVANASGGTLTRIDPATYRRTTIDLGGAHVAALAYGFGRLWVADPTDAELLAIDPTSGKVARRLQVDAHPTALGVAAGALLIADYYAGSVTELDPRSGKPIFTVSVGHGPAAVAFGDDGAIWVANSLDKTVSRIDPAVGAVVATLSVGEGPVALAVTGHSVLVANEYSSSVSRIDVRRNAVVGTSAVPGGPTALAAADGRVWVGTRALDEHHGGTLVLLHTRPLSLDPALQGDLPPQQSNGLTYDALLGSIPVGGTEQLVPNLAENVPTATDDETTYVFRLRHGLHYWTGQPVRAGDFRRAIERLFRVRSGWSGNYQNILGANDCMTKRCDLARGIVTDDAARTITFHLSAPDRYFLATMTSMATAPVPPGTPFRPLNATAIPGTGPYVVASASKREIRYVRNPYFRKWSHAAQPDGNPDVIVMRYGLTPTQEAREVENGKADWTADGIPAVLQQKVLTRFPAQLHYLPVAETDFFRVNTTRAPFNDLRVRQALNLAIDRAALVRMWGSAVATPTCQVLPPTFLGYHRYCPYTRNPRPDGRWTAPDLARARRLVAASGTQGEQITVWGASDGPVHENTVVPYTVGVLRRLGYHTRARLVPSNYWDHHPRVFKTMQLIEDGLANGTTFDFFENFACNAPGNTHFFCNHRLDPAFRETNALEANDPRAAAVQWSRIDRELVDQAAWVPLVNVRWVDFVSARVHNYEADPTVGFIADQASLH